MVNLANVILTIFIVAQFEGIQCNPLNVEKEIGNASRNVRIFKPDKNEWVHFHHSWGLPHFPSLTSVSNLFQDDDDKEKIATKKRLEALEKNQKEILTILQKLNDRMSAKNNQTKAESASEKPQTSISTSVPSTVSTPVPSTMSTSVLSTVSTPVPSTVSTPVPSTMSTSVSSSVSTPAPSTMSSTSVPSTVSTPISSTASSSISSTTSSTPVTRATVIETSTVQDITQQPQSSPSSEESQPRIPDQNENANSDSNSNTGDNQAAADSAGQQSSPAPDTNSGSIVAFTSDENEKRAETTESTA